MMNTLYLLLYLPLAGVFVLWSLAGIKLAKEWRTYTRERILGVAMLELSIALFLAGYAIMVVTHGRSFKAAMLFVIAMSGVNFFLMKFRNSFDNKA